MLRLIKVLGSKLLVPFSPPPTFTTRHFVSIISIPKSESEPPTMQPISKSLHMLTTIPKINHHSLRNLNVWASAIRNASSPQEALYLYTQQLQQQQHEYCSHSILFTLNSIARSPKPNLTIISHLHAHILKIGFNSHVYVATSLLHSYVVCSFKDARLLFDEIPERNAVTFNTMITGYSKLGDLRNAHLLFNGMIIKDIGSWSAMIAGYMSSNNWEEGLVLFREMMIKESLKPDQIMLVSILSGCTHMGSLGLLMGKSIHCFVQKNGWELSVELGTVLVDMYTKCGFVESAFRVFEKMQERNVMSWSAMICGFAQHGNGEKALAMFEEMKASGVRPNEVTFTGILSACTHAGLIDQGQDYFSSMVKEYSLEPRIQHYGCMVDLLGKAGRLDEAFELIRTMKLEPNVIVWSSLLAACKVHKRFEMAERVIDRVLKVAKPEENGGVYTLISDLYALNGKWEEAQKVRELMVSQKVKKARGSSFIRTGNTTGTTQTVL